MRIFTSTVVSLLLYSASFSQWQNTFNSTLNGNDVLRCVASDAAGNVFTAGFVTNPLSLKDYVLIKYSSSGQMLWVKTYNGGTDNDEVYAITVDGSGNIYVTGRSIAPGNGYDYCTIKYDPSGAPLWNMRYNNVGSGDDEAYAITIDGPGNVYVTGGSMNPGNNLDYCTIKYNSSGQQQFVLRYNGPGNGIDEAYAITIDGSGNIFVTGRSQGNGTGYDYCTIKYNDSGQQQWVQRFDGSSGDDDFVGDDEAVAIIVDGNGNSIITGYSESASKGFEYCTISYNWWGQQNWVKQYNGPGNSDDKAYSIGLANNDNVVVTGSSRSGPGEGSEDYATIKYRSNDGNEMWVSRYNGSGNSIDIAYSVGLTVNNSDIYVTGSSRSGTGAGSEDLVTLRYNPSGNFMQQFRYNGTGNGIDAGYDIEVLDNQNIHVAGFTTGNGTGYDGLSIKHVQGLVGINKDPTSVPDKYALYQNYPNPFNPSTSIKFDIIKNTWVRLSVYDILGRVVTVLFNDNLDAGNYEVTFSDPQITSGVYFYELLTDDYKALKKMMLIK